MGGRRFSFRASDVLPPVRRAIDARRRPRTAAAVGIAVGLAAAWAAGAGGIDQSGQPVTLIFGDGNYAELGLAYWMPSIEGTDAAGNASGNVYDPIATFAAGVRYQLGERWTLGLIVDRPFGVDVNYELDYPDPDFPYAGTTAEPESLGVTGLVRYRLGDRFSLHGGLRATRIGAEVGLDGAGFGPIAGYAWDGDDAWGWGYVVGGAYEIPEIALRVALTYGSETEHALDSTELLFGARIRSTTDVTMPQSVNLDFQTGVAPGTLVFGTVRWVDWSDWSVAPQAFSGATGEPLVAFADDAWTYRLGLGRQFTEAFSAAVEIAHETPKGQMMSVLDPYDGYTAVGLGGTWQTAGGLSLTGGVSYSFLGDAEVAIPGSEPARFDDNNAVTVALKLGYRF